MSSRTGQGEGGIKGSVKIAGWAVFLVLGQVWVGISWGVQIVPPLDPRPLPSAASQEADRARPRGESAVLKAAALVSANQPGGGAGGEEVEAFSEAYFVLLRSLPELKPYLMAFERVVISGKNVSIRVSDTGAARLSARRARQLVESFRGS